jgi:acetyl esterase/lipase
MALLLVAILTALGPVAAAQVLDGLIYRTVDGAPLHLDLYRPDNQDGPRPTVLLIHGGSWIRGTRKSIGPFANYLLTRGFSVASLDYRLAPRYTYPAQLEDVYAAERWLKAHAEEYQLDVDHFFLVGFSAGGQLASLAGVRPDPEAPPVRGVVDFYGPTNFVGTSPNYLAALIVNLYFGDRAKDPAVLLDASPLAYVSPQAPPFLIVHGTKDLLVPFEQSAALTSALREAGVEVTLLAVKGAGHGFKGLGSAVQSEVWPAVDDFLTRLAPSAAENRSSTLVSYEIRSTAGRIMRETPE